MQHGAVLGGGFSAVSSPVSQRVNQSPLARLVLFLFLFSRLMFGLVLSCCRYYNVADSLSPDVWLDLQKVSVPLPFDATVVGCSP